MSYSNFISVSVRVGTPAPIQTCALDLADSALQFAGIQQTNNSNNNNNRETRKGYVARMGQLADGSGQQRVLLQWVLRSKSTVYSAASWHTTQNKT